MFNRKYNNSSVEEQDVQQTIPSRPAVHSRSNSSEQKYQDRSDRKPSGQTGVTVAEDIDVATSTPSTTVNMNVTTTKSSPIRLETISQTQLNAPNKADTATATATLIPPKPVLTRLPSVQTKYMEMLLHLDNISSTYNLLASLFTWVILAGFLVLPGTFTTFKKTKAFQDLNNDDSDDSDQVAHTIVHTVANIGLLWLSGAFCVVGAVGCLWLWFRWRQNYIWLINRIFLPVILNSVAGLITTLINVYTAQKGIWSVTAKITALVTGSCVGGAGFFFAIYNFWALRRVREAHERDMRLENQLDEAVADALKINGKA